MPAKRPDPTILIIFGASGDLTSRKIVPALYNLFVDHWLPDDFAVVGMARTPMSDDASRDHLRQGVAQFSRRGPAQTAPWDDFARHLTYVTGDYQDDVVWQHLTDHLRQLDTIWHTEGRCVFYLATPPALFEPIGEKLSRLGLCRNCDLARVVVEKPFGRDLTSARNLNMLLRLMFEERQIYRIDHYLGKETVQNILAFRFGNTVFEPLWNRNHVDHVQITVAETIGTEHRGGYYDQSGALRDMMQNHILQMLCLTAMEPPISFQADEIRDNMADVLRAIQPIAPDEATQLAVRGQYGAGTIDNTPVVGYRHETDVPPDSNTETFAALKLEVNNWRWQGTPFYVRTGKRLALRATEIAIQFKPVPHLPFPAAALAGCEPNRIVIRVQPQESILLRVQVKQPGLDMRLSSVNMDFGYADYFGGTIPEAYETLLLDVMKGDATLFMRADQVEAAWSLVTPVLDAWEASPPADFPNYAAGSWGPPDAPDLMERDGRRWLEPEPAQQPSA
jgi:glucose-6-phosphate 1-dehydrogenase